MWGQSDLEPDSTIVLGSQVVTGSPIIKNSSELAIPVSSIEKQDLNRRAAATLGETLNGTPGVHATSFGPGSSRPIIRGFGGDRIRILAQGLDSYDVSQTSPDHGVSVEPLFAEKIEVVRGPASLLYGSAAIGGVVNVIGKELPRTPAERPLSGEFEVSYGSVSDEKAIGLALQGGGEKFAWSLGHMERDSGDTEIPGYSESNYQRELEKEHDEEDHEEENHDDEIHEEESVFGLLDNSFVDTQTGYAGLTWFGEKGSFGISYSDYASEYGLPGHAHSSEEHENEEEDHASGEEAVSIELDQSRFMARGEWLEAGDFFERIELDASFGDYRHIELEGEEIGTTFERDGFETRMTGVHRSIGPLTGAIGLQYKEDSSSAVGEEAFVPNNETAMLGLFAVERLNRDWGAWEFGGRLEQVDVKALEGPYSTRDFSLFNASIGWVRSIGERSVATANLSYAERSPNATELYAFGSHVARRSFEIGDDELEVESSVNLDISYRIVAGKVTGEITLFHSDFSDYVYHRLLGMGEVETLYNYLDTGGLPVYQATASDASFYGFEIDLRYHVLETDNRSMYIDLLIDQTRATNTDFNSNLPRIPTRRIGTRCEYNSGPWGIGFEGRYHFESTHLAPLELPSDEFFLFNADFRYRIQESDSSVIDLFAMGRNLGNKEARLHTSFVKDIAPLAGRNFILGIRISR